MHIMKFFVTSSFLVISLFVAFAVEGASKKGVRISGGARHDELRMCAANKAGEPGGPFADISLVYYDKDFEFNLPVMRPILFGAAFKMLQFEPEVTWTTNRSSSFFVGFGFGLVFHYGPDYEHDLDDRGKEFYAGGPRASLLLATQLFSNPFGIRIFGSPLYSEDYDPVTVYGAGLEYTFQ